MSIASQLAKTIKKQLKIEKLASDLKGEGMYVFENKTNGDLYLPRPTHAGRRLVRKGEQFVGDNYYFHMLPSTSGPGSLSLVKELQSPEQERLLTEQPPVVTEQGSVEFVAKQKYNESQPNTQDVLLTESPTEGIQILK